MSRRQTNGAAKYRFCPAAIPSETAVLEMTFSRILSLALFLFVFLPFSRVSDPVRAQIAFAELVGEVRDETGAPVSGASLILTRTETNRVVRIVTGTDGGFTATSLPPGTWRIEVEAPGFHRIERTGVTLGTGERIRLDFRLVVGPVEDVLAISGDASLLRTESGSLGQVISQKTINAVPLNGRNILSLVALAPGVAAPPRTSEGPSLPRLNGGRPRVNEFLFDGVSVLQPEPGQVAFFPVLEAIQEFKVELNTPPAEFGRFNGGVINLTTRSGTNDLHGTAFSFLRNEALNARNLFAVGTPASPEKPVFRRQQYGFVIGGPIVRDKTFFFADFQGTRQRIGRTRISTVPTLAQRAGDFSGQLGAPLFLTPGGAVTPVATGNSPILLTDTEGRSVQARTGQIFRPTDRLAYAGNRIPTAQFDPVAARLLARFPVPTSPGNANNYLRTAAERLAQDQFDLRLDHRFSSSDQFFARYSFAADTTDPVTPLPDGSGLISNGAIGDTRTRGQSFVASEIHTFSANFLNEIRFGYTRRAVRRRAVAVGDSLTPALNGTFGNVLPTFTIAGFQQLGSTANTNSDFATDVTQFYDAVSLQRGRHSLKFGTDLRFERLDILQPPSPAGQYAFNTFFTDAQGIPGIGNGLSTFTGNAFAGFLLGQVQSFSIDLQPKVLRPRARIAEFFAQDVWRVTSRLNLQLGVRYTLNFPSTEADNQGAVFNLQTQQLDYLGQSGFPDTARRLHKLNFGPRIGLAYRIGERTVIRSGFGLTWQEQAGITTPFTTPQFPFLQTVTRRTLDNLTPAFTLAQGPAIEPIPLSADAGLGQGVFAVSRDLGSGYVQQWNLAIQRELNRNLVFEVAYAGSRVVRVGLPDTNINQLTIDQLALGSTLLERVANPFFGQIPRNSSLGDPTITRAQLLRPYPRFTTVSLYRNNVGTTSYHALQAKLEQRFDHGLSYLVAYTRSKLIDEASSVFDASILSGPVANFPVADSFNRRLERDVSSGDLPNVFVASARYEFPFFKKQTGALGRLLGGWELSGILTLQSGLPLAISQATNFNAFAGFGTQRPNRIADPILPADQRSVARYFGTSAFTIAPRFTLGTSSRNPVRGPAYRNLDLALIKRTPLTDRLGLEFRAEAFNFTNTPPLGNPNVVLGTPGFGSITSAGDPRVIQFGLKLHF